MENKLSPSFLFGKINKMVEILTQENSYSFDQATEMIYQSELYSMLENEETKVWHYSPVLLIELLLEEIEKGKMVFPEEAA
jgi:hypothetical protein